MISFNDNLFTFNPGAAPFCNGSFGPIPESQKIESDARISTWNVSSLNKREGEAIEH